MTSGMLSLPQGARFFRADLHIHSYGGSHDVKDKLCTPAAIIAAAKKEGLDIIGIADHNEISSIADAVKAATKEGLLLVPAVELSTPQGHLLCYFPNLDALQRFHAQLTIHDRGKPTCHCQQGMADCLGLVQKHGGFAMLAHVDGGAGFETVNPTTTPYKKDVICHEALAGVELKSAASDIRYADNDPNPARKALGRERAAHLGLGLFQPLARVLNSDSHTLQALGRNASGDNKVTRFKMNALTFESLHLALLDSDARVRIEDEIPPNVPQIVGIQMSGGFLADQAIHFSSNLNCIIGGRGTGKSTTFEAIRCLSGYPGEPATVVDSDAWPDQVDLLVRDQSGQTHTITRAKGGALENPDDPFAEPLPFPIECYRQGETHDISQRAQEDPAALLDYLDRFIEIQDDLAAEDELRDRLLALQTKIEEANDRIDRIPKYEIDLKSAKRQIAAVEKAKGKEVIAIQRIVAQERAVREAILAQANAIAATTTHDELKANVDAIKVAADPASLQVGSVEFVAITKLATTFETQLAASDKSLKASSAQLHRDIQAQLKAWQAKAQVTAQQVEAKKKALEAQGVRVDVAYFQKLANDEARLTTDLTKLNTWKPHRAQLVTERNACLKERWQCRERIATKRAAFGTKANDALKALSDLQVTLKFGRSAYSPEANEIIVTAMGWRTVQVPRATALTEDLTIPALLAAIAKKDAAPITTIKGADSKSVFSAADAASIIERLGEPATRYKLERCVVVDRPRLTVTRMVVQPDGKKVARTRDFSQLSLGQQQSVLLALMLSADSTVPLIIDQPEDHLDSEFIYHSIVPVLRRAKERRQVIVVTHNANIAVLGDAEQVIVLKSNAEKGTIVARGSIDDPATRDAACTILEGAKDAFKRRARIYGFRITD
jgi:energy-coupling factor transporter ATP-binding protein EcfA2